MSVRRFLAPALLGRARPETPVTRAMLDLDAGALLEPTDYPYPPGSRPIRPFVGRIVAPLGNVRADAQAFPPLANVLGRTLAHITYVGLRRAQRAATRQVSGATTPAKPYPKVRPWLFGGGSSTSAQASSGSSANGSAPCEGCE